MKAEREKLSTEMWAALLQGMQALLGPSRSEYVTWFEDITRKNIAQLDETVHLKFVKDDYRLLAAFELFRRTKAQRVSEDPSLGPKKPIRFQQDRETGRVRLDISSADWERLYEMTKQVATGSGKVDDMERMGAKTLWKRLKDRERV